MTREKYKTALFQSDTGQIDTTMSKIIFDEKILHWNRH